MKRANRRREDPRARHGDRLRGQACHGRALSRMAAAITWRLPRREVVLAGGPINSPQLLKLSGIGPADELRQLGIAVVADRPGVGENLQDHLEFYFQVASKAADHAVLVDGPLRPRHDRRRAGCSRATDSAPPTISRRAASSAAAPASNTRTSSTTSCRSPCRYDGSRLASEHGFQAHVGPMRSKSRGFVRLALGRSAARSRAIRFNYMSEPEDWAEMRACVRLTREIFAQKSFDRYRGREISAGRRRGRATRRSTISSAPTPRAPTTRHAPAGWAARDDPLAVVDAEARVIGVEGLRVVDSSIMPSITTGNLNAPTIMIGEKASDMILGRVPLAPSNAPYYVAPNWETTQR